MRIGSAEIAEEWCRGLDKIRYRHGEVFPNSGRKLSIQIPAQYPRILVFIDYLLQRERSISSSEALLLITDFFVRDETATTGLFNLLRPILSGDSRSLNDAPATILGSSDFDSLYYLVLLIVLGEWDAVFVPRDCAYIIYFSHHRIVDLIVNDESSINMMLQGMKQAKFIND
jgi:hypothetical protein